MSVMSPLGTVTVLAASSPWGEVIEQLQFTMGEGPCLDAYALGRPVLTADLASASSSQWPGYASAAQEHGVQAVFAFPLQIGAVRLGALDMYRSTPGDLPGSELAAALLAADAAALSLLHLADGNGRLPAGAEPGATYQSQVHQATGMVVAQLGIPEADALALIRAHAYSHDQSVASSAHEVIGRRLTFSASPDQEIEST